MQLVQFQLQVGDLCMCLLRVSRCEGVCAQAGTGRGQHRAMKQNTNPVNYHGGCAQSQRRRMDIHRGTDLIYCSCVLGPCACAGHAPHLCLQSEFLVIHSAAIRERSATCCLFVLHSWAAQERRTSMHSGLQHYWYALQLSSFLAAGLWTRKFDQENFAAVTGITAVLCRDLHHLLHR